MSESDSAVLKEWFTRRDPAAFRAITVRYSGMVYATCRRVLNNATDAEDVTQDCFETLAKATRAPERHLACWLHRVATNLSLNRIRTEQRRKARESAYSMDRGDSAEPTWDDLYEHVDEAIAELPDRFRYPVIAHFLDGRTQQDIATELAISRPAAAYRIAQGVERIGKALRRKGVVTPAALGALMGAHLARAESVPTSVTSSLGRLALTQAGKASAAGLGNTMATWSALKITTAIAAVLVALLGLAAGAQRYWRSSASSPDNAFATREATKHVERSGGGLEQAPKETDATSATAVTEVASNAAPDENTVNAVRGRVIDSASGHPLRDIEVTLHTDPAGPPVATQKTDSAGAFTFARSLFSPGRFTVRANDTTRTYLPSAPSEVVWTSGQSQSELLLKLDLRGTLSGRVLTAEGTPAPGVDISLEGGRGSWTSLATSGLDGSYRFAHDGGDILLRTTGWGIADCEPVALSLAPAASMVHDFVLPPATCLRFRLATPDGKPVNEVGRVRLRMTLASGENMHCFTLNPPKDKDWFLIPYAAPGAYEVVFKIDRYPTLFVPRFVVMAGDKTKEFNLVFGTGTERLGALVLDERGHALSKVEVKLSENEFRNYGEGDPAQSERAEVTSTSTDAEGKVWFEKLGRGEYELTAESDDGDELAKETVTLPRAGAVTLRLTTPLPNRPKEIEIPVRWIVTDGQNNEMELNGSLANIYAIRVKDGVTQRDPGNLVPGDYLCVCAYPGRAAAFKEVSIAATGKKDPTEIRLSLGQGGSISGVARRENGTPIAETRVLVYPADRAAVTRFLGSNDDDRYDFGSSLGRGIRTASDGTFTIPLLPAGSYRVGISPDDLSSPIQVQVGEESGAVEVLCRDKPAAND